MKKLLNTLLNHERYQTLSVIAGVLLLIWFWGCQSEVTSLLEPDQKVNRQELELELNSIMAVAEMRFGQLDQQDELKQFLMQQALLAGQSGTINPFALMTSIGAILGLGATIDNVRKRKEIKSMKT